MSDTVLPLADGFAEADFDAWRERTKKGLSDASTWEAKYVRRTLDALALGPLGTGEDLAETADAPRRQPPPPEAYPWDIRTPARHPDPKIANAQALDDLAGGASSLELRVDPLGETGVLIRTLDDLDTALDGVLLEAASVSLDAGDHTLAAGAMLCALHDRRATPAISARFALNIDPIGCWASQAAPAHDPEAAIAATMPWVQYVADAFPAATSLRVDARRAHEAGLSPAGELRFAAGATTAYLRAMTEAGLSPHEAARHIRVALAVDANAHQSIAKLMAWRRIWSRIAHAFGAEDAPALIDAFGSNRMLTARDPWTNMIRLTLAGFAAAVGGADAIALPAFTDAIGEPDAFARRWSRNAQLLLMSESHLGRVTGPAAGSFFHERLSDALAERAWEAFRADEGAGGLISVITEGGFADALTQDRLALTARIAERSEEPLIGVSRYAQREERAPSVATVDRGAVRAAADKRPSAPRAIPDALASPEQVLSAATAGQDLRTLTDALSRPSARANPSPFTPIRLAAPFEALREAADAATARDGRRPTAALVLAGDPKRAAAAAGRLRDGFAAGGIDVTTVLADALQDLPGTGAGLAIVYADGDVTPDAARGLVEAVGAMVDTVWVAPAQAGKAGADVDRVLTAEDMTLEDLRAAHQALGLASTILE